MDLNFYKSNIRFDSHKYIKNFEVWYNKYVYPYTKVKVDDIKYKDVMCCAQFLIHKDKIKKYPKKFYINLYNWIITTNTPNYWNGRYFEWIWHILWS